MNAEFLFQIDYNITRSHNNIKMQYRMQYTISQSSAHFVYSTKSLGSTLTLYFPLYSTSTHGTLLSIKHLVNH